MTKAASKASNELFMLALVVIVIVAAVTIMFSSRQQSTTATAAIEGDRAESSADLMKVLDSTIDDEGRSDFIQLNKDASGL